MKKSIKKISIQSKINDDSYVEASPAQRILMVWEITKDTWAFMGNKDVERRLQRHIAKFIRRKS